MRVFLSCLCLNVIVVMMLPGAGIGGTIIAFGDSLTEGCGVPGQYYYDCGSQGRYDTYPLYLEQIFNNDGDATTIKNFGIGGEQTSEGVNRIDSVLNDVCNQCVDYFLLMEGTNDLFHHVDEATVYYNLSTMVDKIRAKGIQPILATITPDPDSPWKNITLMNNYIRNLAVEKDVFLVDQYNALAGNWYWYTHPQGCYEDQLHPNTYGFQDMAAVWYDSLLHLKALTTSSTAYPTSALVKGSVDVSTGAVSGLAFQYGEDCKMDKTVTLVPSTASGTGRVSVQTQISNLKPETMYYYRFIATQNGSIINGGTKSFITPGESLTWLKLLLGTP